MAGLLQSVELWLGLGSLLLVAMLMGGSRKQRQKEQARLARVMGQGKGTVNIAQAQQLRKRDPNADSKMGQKLAQFSFVETLQGRFEAAGMTILPQQFLLRCGLIMLGVAGFLLLLGKPPLLALLLGLIAGLGLPQIYVKRRIRKRQMQFIKLFPEAIDLIVRGLRAGLPVAESFIVVSREIPDPVGRVFFTMSQQTGLGVPMEKALSDTAKKLDMTEFNFFVTTIILQRETGGNLGEILSNLSQVLRDRQMMKLKIMALSSEARASAYIVGSLPIFVFCILSLISPEYLDPLYDDYRGNLSLAGAVGMMLLGGFIMKRMTQMEI